MTTQQIDHSGSSVGMMVPSALETVVEALVKTATDRMPRVFQIGDLRLMIEPASLNETREPFGEFLRELSLSSLTAAPSNDVDDRWAALDTLTKREKQVCRLAIKGYQNQEIADQLSITLNTAKRHLYNAYNKLGVDSRTQLSYLFRMMFLNDGDEGISRRRAS